MSIIAVSPSVIINHTLDEKSKISLTWSLFIYFLRQTNCLHGRIAEAYFEVANATG